MQISVIATVYNEGNNLCKLLDSLIAQTRRPDEVVIADGGSTDNTLAILAEYEETGKLPLKVIPAPGSNISEGRNVAIRAAAGPIIAATDAGVRLDPQWLEKLVEPLENGQSTAAGFFQADPQTPFEVAMGATVLPAEQDIDRESFLPSSRSVAFMKSSWEAAGGYPEWLDYCEDLIFDMALQAQHGPFPFVPEALAYFRPRSSLKAFFIQYYRYARGDGKADLWRKRHVARYLTYLAALPVLLWLGCKRWSGAWLLLGLGGLAYTLRPFQRLQNNWAQLSPRQRVAAVLLIPIIRLVGDVAKMFGYPAGVWWRWRSGRARDWRAALSHLEITR